MEEENPSNNSGRVGEKYASVAQPRTPKKKLFRVSFLISIRGRRQVGALHNSRLVLILLSDPSSFENDVSNLIDMTTAAHTALVTALGSK
jgi:hypothetical protein